MECTRSLLLLPAGIPFNNAVVNDVAITVHTVYNAVVNCPRRAPPAGICNNQMICTVNITIRAHIICIVVAADVKDVPRRANFPPAGIPPHIDVVIYVTIAIYIIRTNINDVRRVNLNILDSSYYLGYIFGAGTET